MSSGYLLDTSAFIWWLSDHRRLGAEARRLILDGSNPVRLTTTEDYAVRCTPDGKWAVYGGYGAGYSSAWKKRIDGGDPIQLTATPVYSPSPSPDGKLIACLTIIEPGVPQKLLLLPIDGGSPVKSFKTPQNIGVELRWSPDGREIYYNDTRADVSNLWAQPLDGTPARQVTRSFRFALWLSLWSDTFGTTRTFCGRDI